MEPRLPYMYNRDSPTYSAESPDEPPLARPKRPGAPKSLCDAKIMCSIDTSGSTSGPVLDEERNAVEAIAGLLSVDAIAKLVLGPWSSRTNDLRYITQLRTLRSSGGTDPCSIIEDQAHVRAIHSADIWILLTDGEIAERKVSRFANMLPQSGMHNQPCVIVIFGYRPALPAYANISVGVSLYSVVPDCLFLFHDVDSHEIFIFQSKGCFDVLNTQKTSGKMLNTDTQWYDLPRISYQDLQRVRLPAKRDLRSSEIMLQDGDAIDFDKLLSGNISANETDKVLGNEDNLNAIILTASTRGSRDQVRKWIKREKDSRGLCIATRRDNSSAEQLVARAIHLLQMDDETEAVLHSLRYTLRAAHRANWMSLIQSVEEDVPEHDEQSQAIESAMERISFIDRSGTTSPAVLSPVSPRNMARTSASTSSDRYRRRSLYTSGASARRDQTASMTYAEAAQKTLFVPGYRKSSGLKSPLTQDCNVCGEESESLMLLLTDCPTENCTEGFAAPGSLADVSCPLALAFYPETDIVSRLHCCDSCAFHIVNARLEFQQRPIANALPIDIDLTDDTNRAKWLETVDTALQSRFCRDILPLTMLGIATHKLDELSSGGETQVGDEREFRTALRRMCNNLVPYCNVLFSDGRQTPIVRVLGDFDDQLCKWLSDPNLQRPPKMDDVLELLQQPFESFLLLSRHTQWTNPLQETRCVFVRLIVHMIDECMVAGDDAMGNGSAPAGLQSKLQSLSRQSFAANGIGHTMSDLVANGLIEETAYSTLLASVGPWQDLSNRCGGALDCVLKLLVSELAQDRTLSVYHTEGGEFAVFEQWLLRHKPFRALCQTPWELGVVAAFQAQVV